MKVLYIPDHKFTLTRLKQRLGDFTLHNGCWPELIFMEVQGLKHYCFLMEKDFPPEKFEFMGIRIGVIGGKENK